MKIPGNDTLVTIQFLSVHEFFISSAYKLFITPYFLLLFRKKYIPPIFTCCINLVLENGSHIQTFSGTSLPFVIMEFNSDKSLNE